MLVSLAGNIGPEFRVLEGAVQLFVPQAPARLKAGIPHTVNMATETAQTGQSAAPMNVFSRFVGIITAPGATFQRVVAHPKVFGMLALVCVLSAVSLGIFFSTKTGQDAWVEAASSSSLTGEMSDQQYEAMQKMAPYAGYFAIGQALVGMPIMLLITAGILFAVFNAAAGGNATFRQVFAVVVHSWPVLIVSQLFTLPLSYARGTLSSATNLAVLLPMLDESSFLGQFFGMIDLFWVWAAITLSIGLAVLYRRKTRPVALALLGVYVVIAVVVAAVKSS
jgi:hypothetical protein